MNYLWIAFLFLSSCTYLKTHPNVENELENVGEELLIDSARIAEGSLEKDLGRRK